MKKHGELISYEPLTGILVLKVGKLSTECIEALQGMLQRAIDVSIDVHREKRSTDANGLLWHCIGELTNVTGRDKWEEYLSLLRQYGKYTYIVVKEKAVEDMKKQWREVEIVGEYDMHGEKGVQLLCYFGSSTYNTKEFSKLLQGTFYEMQQAGLQPPPSSDMRRALEKWEERHGNMEAD
jgi:hypothetical protein